MVVMNIADFRRESEYVKTKPLKPWYAFSWWIHGRLALKRRLAGILHAFHILYTKMHLPETRLLRVYVHTAGRRECQLSFDAG